MLTKEEILIAADRAEVWPPNKAFAWDIGGLG